MKTPRNYLSRLGENKYSPLTNTPLLKDGKGPEKPVLPESAEELCEDTAQPTESMSLGSISPENTFTNSPDAMGMDAGLKAPEPTPMSSLGESYQPTSPPQTPSPTVHSCSCGFETTDPEVMDAHTGHGEGCNGN